MLKFLRAILVDFAKANSNTSQKKVTPTLGQSLALHERRAKQDAIDDEEEECRREELERLERNGV